MLDAFIRHPFMSRAGVAACSPRDFLAAMCRVECALARVQERAGLVPAGTDRAALAHLADGMAADIARQCQPA